MGERFVRDDSVEYVENAYVVDEPRRPRPGLWLAFGLLFLSLGAAAWFWYKAQTHTPGNVVAYGEHGPVILGERDPDYRYIMVREGGRSRVVGGTQYVQPDGTRVTTTTRVKEPAMRAERFDTGRVVTDVDPYVGPEADVSAEGDVLTFSDVVVHEATGDKTFTIHSDRGNLLVFFPEPNDAASERAIQIDGGDRLDVTGVMRRMPSREQMRRVFGVDDREAATLSTERLYLDATRIGLR